MMNNDVLPNNTTYGSAAIEPVNPKKIKWKRHRGLIEWICDREGHEFLIDIDRAFIRDK